MFIATCSNNRYFSYLEAQFFSYDFNVFEYSLQNVRQEALFKSSMLRTNNHRVLQTIITHMVYKKYIKMTFNLRLNIQKTQHTEKQRTSF